MNKKMLLCTVFSAALLMGAGIVNAKDATPSLEGAPKADLMQHHKDFKGKHGFGPLEDKLGLTDEQKEQAKKIHEQGRKEIEPLMNEMKNLREKMDSVRKKNMEEFEKILTPDQKKKLDESKAKRDEKMKEFKEKFGDKKGPRHHGHADFMPEGEDGMLPPPPHDFGDIAPKEALPAKK